MDLDQGKLNLVERLQHGDSANLADELAALQPFDVAEALLELALDARVRVMTRLPTELAADIFEYLEPEDQYHILDHLDEAIARPLLNRMSSDTAVDLLLAIHPNQAAKLRSWLPEEYRTRLDTLMTFPENTAGSLATVDYIAVREAWTVRHTLDHFRKVGGEAEIVSYAYVVNAKGQLSYVVSLRELIMADPDRKISDLVRTEVISVQADTHVEDAARILAQYDFLALPVVDSANRLIGIIAVDDLVDVMQETATEDFQRLGGSAPLTESYFETPVTMLVKKRVGWLLALFLAEAYTGTVLRHFEDTLSQVIALTFFIPLLIGTGGNTGSQIVTTLVRGLAIGEVHFKDMLKVMGRELTAGVSLGVILGLATLIRAYVLGVGNELGAVVGVTALFIVVWASLVAAVLPLILHRLKVDPAVVSGPFITTLVDGTGLFMYFTIARLMLRLG